MIVNMHEGMRFGMGMDSLTESVRGEAVEFGGEEESTGSGQFVTANVLMIESQQSLMKELNISVGASVSYGFAHLDAKMDFAQSNAVNEHSIYVMLKASVTNPARHMKNPHLADPVATLYRNDPDAFVATYGDCYIDEIYGGGEFFGLFIFETFDQASQTNLSGQMRGAIGGFLAGGEITASFRSTIQEFQSKTNMSIRAIMDGGAGLQNPSSLQELESLYKAFNASVRRSPVDFCASLKEYRYLPLPSGPSWQERLVQSDTVKTCGEYIIDALAQRSTVEFMLRYPEQFESYDANALRTYRDGLNERLPKWGHRATLCGQDVTNCGIQPDEEPPTIPALPKRILSADPMGEKLEWILAHDTVISPAFSAGGLGHRTTKDDWQPGPGGGRYILFNAVTDSGQEVPNQPIAGLFYKPGIGAFGVGARIFAAYWANGGPFGPGRYPIRDEVYADTTTPTTWSDTPPLGAGWRVQYFEAGLHDWRPAGSDDYGNPEYMSSALWYRLHGPTGEYQLHGPAGPYPDVYPAPEYEDFDHEIVHYWTGGPQPTVTVPRWLHRMYDPGMQNEGARLGLSVWVRWGFSGQQGVVNLQDPDPGSEVTPPRHVTLMIGGDEPS